MKDRYYIVAEGTLFQKAMIFHSKALNENTTVEDLLNKTIKIYKETIGEDIGNILSVRQPLPNESLEDVSLDTKVTELRQSENLLYKDRIFENECAQIFYSAGWLG